MISVLTKTTNKLVVFAGLTALLIVAFSLKAYADTRPTFQVTGSGDVFAGGGFPDCDDYQSGGNNGAILSFANYHAGSNTTGSTSDYGAFALGNIEGAAGGGFGGGNYHGFGSYGIGNGYKKISFANTTDWGGSFDNSPNKFCIPDYFGFSNSLTPTGAGSVDVRTLASGQKLVSPNSGDIVTITASGPIGLSKTVTLFVDGNAYISNNITYQAGYTVDNMPKFLLVVKGDIYIAPGVTNLTGWYIAQPDSATNGAIWTCHDGTDTKPSLAFIIGCTNSLVVNGAVTTKHINLLRTTPGSDAITNDNYAEQFNYTPETSLGPAFFSQPGGTGKPKIDSVQSLPPIY